MPPLFYGRERNSGSGDRSLPWLQNTRRGVEDVAPYGEIAYLP